MRTKIITLLIVLSISFSYTYSVEHPCLLLTQKDIKDIKKSIGKYPLFDKSFEELKKIADGAVISKIEVPIPKDADGGYTHEKHIKNYNEMYAAGTLFQITKNVKYAKFIRNMLVDYAELYLKIGLHPSENSEIKGKLFWQALFDEIWLVHAASAYDCVYEYMDEFDRFYVEKNLFYPMADFISDGNKNNYAMFNKMHYNSTWATAAVGMIGYVMGNKELIAKALYGSKLDGKSGFIRQLDILFSPDGYFTEGPYYQGYSIWPFMAFAQAIENQQPSINIFKYRNQILLKAVNTAIQCTYNNEFFNLNDALSKTIKTQEIVYAVDLAFKNNPTDKQLLSIAEKQESFTISDAGLETAKAIHQKKTKPFDFQSLLLRDGPLGDEGGIAVMRQGNVDKQTCLTFKATSHGLSHGHYDKLSVALYDNGNSILPDYGSVRFLNIESKHGGNYTIENYSWAMQSIAHNTVTVDEHSHFNADIKLSSANHSNIEFFDILKPEQQVVSGVENNAYNGVSMRRTTALIKLDKFDSPIIIDIFRVKSDSAHTLDFPFYYNGQLVSTNFDYKKNSTELKPLGKKNGYQHLWLEATAKPTKPVACFTFLKDNRFYSISSLVKENTELMLTRIGANDTNYNLRNEPCFMIRQPDSKKQTFVTIIEPHGEFDLTKETVSNSQSNVEALQLPIDNELFTAATIESKNGGNYIFICVNKDFGDSKSRSLKLNGKTISFIGNYYIALY
jgi:hypothetical protein